MGAVCQRQAAAESLPRHAVEFDATSDDVGPLHKSSVLTSKSTRRTSFLPTPTISRATFLETEPASHTPPIGKSRSAGEAVSPRFTTPITSVSNLSLDPRDQNRLRCFYVRNRRAQKRHATMMERQKRLTLDSSSTEASSEKMELYDVFSPDERSARWQEFLEVLANSKHEYDSFKQATQSVRGCGKAMTIAALRQNPDPDSQLPMMH